MSIYEWFVKGGRDLQKNLNFCPKYWHRSSCRETDGWCF